MGEQISLAAIFEGKHISLEIRVWGTHITVTRGLPGVSNGMIGSLSIRSREELRPGFCSHTAQSSVSPSFPFAWPCP